MTVLTAAHLLARRGKVLRLLAALIVATFGLPGSTNSAHARTAEDILRASLAALGGLEPIGNAGGAVVTIEGINNLSAMQQGRSWSEPEDTVMNQRIVIDLAADRTTYFKDWHNYAFSRQRLAEIYDAQGRVLFADLNAGAAFWPPFKAPRDAEMRLRRYLPHFLLQDAIANDARLLSDAPFSLDGIAVEVLEYRTSAGEVLQVRLDAKTGLPLGAAFHMDAELIGHSVIEWRWSGYRPLGELMVPSQFDVTLAGKRLRSGRMDVVLGVPEGAGSLPDSIAPDDPPAELVDAEDWPDPSLSPARFREVAPGAWLFPSIRPGFHLMAFEFDDHVVAIDAPAGWYELDQIPPHQIAQPRSREALTEKFIEGIGSAMPGKPIRYAVMTHHHSDHIGGVKAWADRGVTVIASEPVARAIRDVADARNFPVTIETFFGTRRIADETRALRLIELPEGNPKADGFTVAFFEPENLLYATGFIYPVPEASFPVAESVALSKWFVEWLDSSGLTPAQHFNVHAQARVQDWQLERLRELDPPPTLSPPQ